METSLTSEEQSAKFLLQASLLYKDKCPELSRFLLQQSPMNKASRTLFQSKLVCQYCYQWLQLGNHHVRLRPKQHPSALVQIILRRQIQHKRLKLVQKKLLRRFQISTSILVRAQNYNHPDQYQCCNAAYCPCRTTTAQNWCT
ncbi:hypothetical protein LDENG_00000250 [Lucifuga dentata]|nr:hypothetical protein LDENG_00000250 [Lucifuga dentata]